MHRQAMSINYIGYTLMGIQNFRNKICLLLTQCNCNRAEYHLLIYEIRGITKTL